MADFEKVWSVKIDTTHAQINLGRLQNKTKDLKKSVESVGKGFKQKVGKDATVATKKLNNQLVKTKRNLSGLKKGLDKVSKGLAVMSAGFVAVGGVSVRNVLKLNKGLANVSTLLDGDEASVNAKVEKLKKSVQDMAIETGKSTDDLTEGLYEVISAFQDSADNAEQLAIAAKAGIAGKAGTLEAVKLLSAVTKGYGDTSAEAQKKAANLAFQTVKLGQTTFPELAASMGRVIPTAKAMGTEQEELFAAMATLTGVTGNAAEVSTQLASVYGALLKPSEKLKKLAKDRGYASVSEMAKTEKLTGLLRILKEETNGEADAIAKLASRKEAQVALIALLGDQYDNFAIKQKANRQNTDALDEAFRRQTSGINAQGHSWERTKRRMEVFSQRLGERLLPVMERLLGKLEPLLKHIENLDEETVDSLVSLGKWVTIMALATKGASGLLGVVNSLSGGLGNMSNNAATAVGSMGKLRGAMGVLAAGAAGFAVGTAIDETVLDPERKRTIKSGEKLESAIRTAKHGGLNTAEDIDKAIARLKSAQKRSEEKAGTGASNVILSLAAKAAGHETPYQKHKRLSAEADKQIAGLRQLQLEIMTAPKQSGMYTGQNQTVQNVTVNINESKTPHLTSQSVLRAVKKAIYKDLDRGAISAGGGEG